jgi:chromosome segregation ATPase
MSTADAKEPSRGPGRPRKWANEAERVRAYRQRKAEEHASVDELRVERRVLKRQLSDALRGRARAETALERATVRIESLESALERTQERLRNTETDLASVQSRFRELIEQRGPAGSVTSPEPALSRQQRRAMERNERRRKH